MQMGKVNSECLRFTSAVSARLAGVVLVFMLSLTMGMGEISALEDHGETSTFGAGAPRTVGSTGANPASFTETLARGGTYLYRVQAFNLSTGRVSAYSNTAEVRVR